MTDRGPAETPSLLYLVKRLELVIRAHLDAMLRGSGITTPQYTALTVLVRRDGVSAAQLARDSFVTPQSMAEMLRSLEQRGLIRRALNPRSRREMLVHLTPDGRALVDRYSADAAAIETRMLTELTRHQVQDFRRALTSARSALRLVHRDTPSTPSRPSARPDPSP